MRVYCKRNYFLDGVLKWERGRIYVTEKSRDWDLNVYCLIVTDSNTHIPISKRDFDKYFTSVDEWRDSKIDKILNNE